MVDKYEGAKTLDALKEYLKTQRHKYESDSETKETETAKKKKKKHEL